MKQNNVLLVILAALLVTISVSSAIVVRGQSAQLLQAQRAHLVTKKEYLCFVSAQAYYRVALARDVGVPLGTVLGTTDDAERTHWVYLNPHAAPGAIARQVEEDCRRKEGITGDNRQRDRSPL